MRPVVKHNKDNKKWSNRSYNGQNITYDAIGNPLTWGNSTFTWTAGRRLSSVTMPGKNISYTYGADGYRTSKTVNGVTTTYILDGGRISALKRGSDELLFVYDENGEVTGFYRNGEPYVYAKNLQGDVIGIIDERGAWVVSYEYDAWGKLLSTTGNLASTLGVLNPFRYRSYNYDEETGLYYLNSRYYDPEVGRFLNADTITDGGAGVLGNNLFIYVADNPVNNSDPSGKWIIKNAIKWVAKNVVRPVVKSIQSTFEKIQGTYSKGVCCSFSTGIFDFNFQGGISVDTKGNVALQGTYAVNITSGSPGAAVTSYQTVTNASEVKKLDGIGYEVGTSAGVPVYGVPVVASMDLNVIPDLEANKTYFGTTSNIGFGTPGSEFHVVFGQTKSLEGIKFNVFDLARGIYKKIMEG